MATFTLTGTRFPDGTTVGAYLANSFTAFPENGRPPGTAVATATASNRDVAFSGLEDGTRYFAAAEVGGSFLHYIFVTNPRTDPEVWEAELATHSADTTEVHGIADTAALATAADIAAAVAEVEAVLAERTKFHIDDFGGDPGAADNTAALNAAIAATEGKPGKIEFGDGEYVFKSAPTSMKRRTGLILAGQGGNSGGSNTGTTLVFTGTGERFLDFRSSGGCQIHDLSLFYENEGFTGSVVDLSHDPEGSPSDAAYFRMVRSQIAGRAIRTALGVDLDKAIGCTFLMCNLGGLDIGVRGLKEAGSYTNSVSFIDCRFQEIGTIPVRNPGKWTFAGGFVESLHGGVAGFCDNSGVVTLGLIVRDVWMGDVTSGSGVWIDFSGKGLTVTGCLFGGNANSTAIRASATSSAINIAAGNRIDTFKIGVDLRPGCSGYHVDSEQSWNTVTTKITLDEGTTESGSALVTDQPYSGQQQTGYVSPMTDLPVNGGELTLVKERAYGGIFIPPKRMPVAKLSFFVLTAATSNDPVELAIYNAAKARLATTGEQTGLLNSTGTKTVTLAVNLMPNAIYYITLLCKSVGGTAAKVASVNLLHAGLTQVAGATAMPGLHLVRAAAGASLPETLTIEGGSEAVPAIGVRTS